MVAPQQGQPGWVPHLQSEEEQEGLNAKVPPVHIVAHEQEVGVRQPTWFEFLWQVYFVIMMLLFILSALRMPGSLPATLNNSIRS